MTAVVSNLKRFFLKPEEREFASFRQKHFLNDLPRKDVLDLLHFVELKNFSTFLPDLANKKILLLSHAPSRGLLDKLIEAHPDLIVNYQVDPHLSRKHPQVFTVMGQACPLSLKKECADVLYSPFLLLNPKNIRASLKEYARVIKQGGRLQFSVMHPTLDFILNRKSLDNQDTGLYAPTLQSYLEILRENHFYLEDLTENTADQTTRPFFLGPDDMNYYDEYEGLPLLLTMKAVKFVK